MVARTDNEQFARDFFAAMGPTLEDFKRNYRERMAEDVVWETVGLPAHRGRDACLAYLDNLHARTGMTYCTIDVLNLASVHDVVLTERVDSMYRADGTKIMEFRLMGVIELVDGLIVRYTDYLDTAPLATGMPAAATLAVHP
jgi:limonene-1,2-epoxide hydrolase